MKVRIAHGGFGDAPPQLKKLGWGAKTQFLFTVNSEYLVHAIAVCDGIATLMLVNDANWPQWVPSWATQVTEARLPEDWICTPSDSDPTLLMGPPFIAKSTQDFSKMVELEPEQQALFWERVRRLERRVRARRRLSDRVPADATGTVVELFRGAQNSYLIEFTLADTTLDVITVDESDIEISDVYRAELQQSIT
jgi:hypothetical protein